MPEPVKQESEDLVRAMKWKGLEWDRIGEAAEVLEGKLGFPVSANDIIRSGTMQRVEEILSGKAA